MDRELTDILQAIAFAVGVVVFLSLMALVVG